MKVCGLVIQLLSFVFVAIVKCCDTNKFHFHCHNDTAVCARIHFILECI